MESGVSGQPNGHYFKNANGEIDPSFMKKVLPQIVQKLMEVFQDPSVIEEITQHENNDRQREQNLNPTQMLEAQ